MDDEFVLLACRLEKRGNIKCVAVERRTERSRWPSVDSHFRAEHHALKAERCHAPRRKIVRRLERPPVKPRLLGNVLRLLATVGKLAESFHLPIGRHGDLRPFAMVSSERRRIVEILKVPFAVQRHRRSRRGSAPKRAQYYTQSAFHLFNPSTFQPYFTVISSRLFASSAETSTSGIGARTGASSPMSRQPTEIIS